MIPVNMSTLLLVIEVHQSSIDSVQYDGPFRKNFIAFFNLKGYMDCFSLLRTVQYSTVHEQLLHMHTVKFGWAPD